MDSPHNVNSDLFNINHIVQTVGVTAGKNILIDTLRDVFREDREYKFVNDEFGFPKIQSMTNLDPDAGLDDEENTRIFIGSTYRQDVKFYPAITVKSTGTSYVPISFNQDVMGVIYRKELLMDGYGNSVITNTPAYNVLVGAWKQTFEVKITTESEVDREELTDIVQTILISSKRMELQNAGLFIETLRTGGESEEVYGNGYLYSTSITLETRSEFKIHIPISNLIEKIGLCITFGNLDGGTVDSLRINGILTEADEL